MYESNEQVLWITECVRPLQATSYLTDLYQRTHAVKSYYNTAWRQAMRERLFLSFVEAHGGSRIVDLGCRDGLLLSRLAGDRQIVAIDVDAEALRRYRVRHARHRVSTRLHDLNAPIDLPDASQDIMVAGELIEHLQAPGTLIGEAARILRPGGIFVGSTPNAFRADKRFSLLLGRDPKSFSDETHLQYYSRRSLAESLGRAFQEVEIYAYRGERFTRVLQSVRADGFIWRCVKR